MRYAGIIQDDIVNGVGVCVSLWVQGCPHHCEGCQNPQTWDFNGGRDEDVSAIYEKLHDALQRNGVRRNLSILGGEPLCPENQKNVDKLLALVMHDFPDARVFLWTGYTLEELEANLNPVLRDILGRLDMLVEGRYMRELRDPALELRGSSNQRILDRDKIAFEFNLKKEEQKHG